MQKPKNYKLKQSNFWRFSVVRSEDFFKILNHQIYSLFTLEVRANVQPKSSIPIGAKVENGTTGFF